MLTVHVESFNANLQALRELFKLHYSEISEHRKHGIPLDPDYDEYRRLEASGKLVFFALRSQGQLVGYASGLVVKALHYRTILEWHPDLFFVKLEYRGNHNDQNGGVLLRDAIRVEAKRRGVRLIKAGFKVAHGKHIEKLFRDAGFEPYEVSLAYWL